MQPNETHKVLGFADRRYYQILNVIQEEWRPVIGGSGMDLYGLLVYFSGAESEAYPSTRLMRSHLDMSFDTIRDYMRLLEWCRLISTRINEQPNRRVTESKYIHTLLLPTSVTSDVRQNIELQLQRAERNANIKMATSFPRTLRKRLDKWQSLRAHFREPSQKAEYTKKKPTHLAEKSQTWLKALGVDEKYIGFLSSKTKPYLVIAWTWNAALSEKRINSLGGYLNTMLRKPNAKLRDGLSTLALAYDKADIETRLQMELGIRIDDPQLIKTLTENGSALNVAKMLWQRYETLDPVRIIELM